MRNRLLILLGMAFVAMTSFAQTWTPPEAMDPDTEASDVASEHVYKVKNVETGYFLTGGYVWYNWATSAALTSPEDGAIDPLSFTLIYDEGKKGWTFARTTDGKFTFISGANPGSDRDGWGEMHVDMGSQGHQYFEIIKQENGKYHIRAIAADADYGSSMKDYEYKCWGTKVGETEGFHANHQEGILAVYATVNPDEGFACDWEFIDQNVHLFNVKTELYNLAKAIVDEELNVDYAQYTAVYEGTDYEALKAAKDALQKLVNVARYSKLIDGASDDNPKDLTELVNNADFTGCSKGKFPGWTIYAPNGGNTQNLGDSNVEYWQASAAKGEFDYYQEIAGLPAGKYSLTAKMWNSTNGEGGAVFKATSGVYGTTSVGTVTARVTVDSDNSNMHEYSTPAIVLLEDDTLRIGVKNFETMAARWFGVDWIHLTYYGPVTEDPAKVTLDSYIESLEAKYGDLTTLNANKDTIQAYKDELAKAKAANEDYEDVMKSLENAAGSLQTSIDEYAAFLVDLEMFIDKVEDASDEWPGLGNAVIDIYQDALRTYENGTATTESIAKFADDSSKAIAEYVSKNVTEGKDVTILLNNPGFEKDFSGWTVDEDGATPVWGGMNMNLENTIEGDNVIKLADLNSGNAEVYHKKFSISQVIKNMPEGSYTFSCQAFGREDSGRNDSNGQKGLGAEFFAIVNGTEQTQTVKDLLSQGSDEILYQHDQSDWDTSLSHEGEHMDLNDNVLPDGIYYVPNTMCGANVYFAAGYYKNAFTIIVDAKTDITVGVRDIKDGGDWILFDDFKIVYNGKDANLLNKPINDLIEQVNAAKVNENDLVLTKDVKKEADAAIAAGYAAIAAGNDFEASSDAISALRQALADVQKNLAFVTEFYNEWYEMDTYRFELDEYYGDDFSFNGKPEILETIGNKLITEDLAFADSAEVEKYRLDMKKAYTDAVMDAASVGSASEGSPADVTAAIYNPNCMSYDVDDEDNRKAIGTKGWNVTVKEGTDITGDGGGRLVQVYKSSFDINQTIYNLTPGYYRVKVNGFYRDGNGSRIDSCLNNVEGFEEHPYATLYAGAAETPLLLITAGNNIEDYVEYIEDTGIEGVTTDKSFKVHINDEEAWIPNQATAAYGAFHMGFYDSGYDYPLWQNILQFKVENGQESVTIGIRKEHDGNVKADPNNNIEAVNYDDWTIWSDWRLEYLGTEEPENDPTTAIKGVDYTMAPAKAAIYNIAGQRVNKAVKGLYIINGKKVVVK